MGDCADITSASLNSKRLLFLIYWQTNSINWTLFSELFSTIFWGGRSEDSVKTWLRVYEFAEPLSAHAWALMLDLLYLTHTKNTLEFDRRFKTYNKTFSAMTMVISGFVNLSPTWRKISKLNIPKNK